MSSKWTGSKGISDILTRKWERGYMLKSALCNDNFFPFCHKLVHPTQNEVATNLSEVIAWRKGLIADGKSERGYGYEVLEKEFHYSVLGKNSVPTHFCVGTPLDAARLIGKQKELETFMSNAASLIAEYPALNEWVEKNPFKVVAIGSNCEAVLKILNWFVEHNDRYIYIRQIDIDGVDTKFIESNKAVLNELLVEILPVEIYKPEENRFEQRYGLKTKPDLVRLRILDEKYAVHGITDITIPISELRLKQLPFKRIFITENEINFLSFPNVQDACVFFGRGYGVDVLKELPLIDQKDVIYWGDIDTHGLNILSHARGFLPHIKSILMSEEILLMHKRFWVKEDKPFLHQISRLTDSEYSLACRLQADYFGHGVRLEQERIRFSCVMDALSKL